MELKGYVDIINDEVLLGWAVNLSNPTDLPVIEIVQAGRVVLSFIPSTSYPHLLKVLKIDQTAPAHGLYRWRVAFPLANGVAPGVPFDIRFAADKSLLVHGLKRTIAAMSERTMAEVRDSFDNEIMISPGYSVENDTFVLNCQVRNWAKGLEPVTIQVNGERMAMPVLLNDDERSMTPNRFSFLDNPTVAFNYRVPRQALEARPGGTLIRVMHPNPSGDPARAMRHRIRNSLFIPRNLFDTSVVIPPGENITRVSGGPNALGYRLGGATTLLQLNEISWAWAGVPLSAHRCVVDWGVGCARVLRHMWESRDIFEGAGPFDPAQQRLIGLDVDKVNVAWCQQNLAGRAHFAHIDFAPPVELGAAEVDFLYGISVMTHLTEMRQMQWLAEIRRLLRPGGIAVLTANCEWNFMQAWWEPGMRFVDRYGFFDMAFDAAIGEGNVRHYRRTHQTTWHVRETWSDYLEILDVIPAANAWSQSFIVMRRPA